MQPTVSLLYFSLWWYLLTSSCSAQILLPISGTVQGEDQEPVNNARVLILGETIVDGAFINPQAALLGTGQSNRDGEFVIEFSTRLPAALRKLTAVCIAGGFALESTDIRSIYGTHKLSFRLKKSRRSLQGLALDEKNTAITDGSISVRSIRVTKPGGDGGNGLIRFDLAAAHIMTTKTDSLGQFTVDGLPIATESVRLQIDALGRSPGIEQIKINASQDAPTPVTLKMLHNTRLHGRLVETKRSLSNKNASLKIACFLKGSPVGEVAVTSNVDGYFDCDLFDADSLAVSLEAAPGRHFKFFEPRKLAEINESPLMLQMPELSSTADGNKKRREPLLFDFHLTTPGGAPLKQGLMLNGDGLTFEVVNGECLVSEFDRGGKFRVYATSRDGSFSATKAFPSSGPRSLSLQLGDSVSMNMQLIGNNGSPVSRVSTISDPTLEINVALAIESGVSRCRELEMDETILGLAPSFGFTQDIRTSATHEEGVTLLSGLIPGARYVFTHTDSLKIRKDGLPIYVGCDLTDAITIPGRMPSVFGFRAGANVEGGLITLSTRPRIAPLTGAQSASFGSSLWEIHGCPQFEIAASKLLALKNGLSECVVDVGAARGGGSGTVVTNDGIVLTCAHLFKTIGEPATVQNSNQEKFSATVQSLCPDLDLAAIKMDISSATVLKPVERSNAEPTSGQWCIIVGYPGNATEPIFRLAKVLHANDARIITTGPLLGGDSGGPVLDLDGNLIGVNSGGAIFENYHAPISERNDHYERLLKGEFWRVMID